MIVFSQTLLSVFGPGFAQAQTVMVILGSSMLIATLVGPVDVVLLMAGKSSWNLLNTMVAVVVNVVLNLILIPRYGISRSRGGLGREHPAEQPPSAGTDTGGSCSCIRSGGGPRSWPASAIGCFGVVAAVARGVIGDDLIGLIVSSLVATPIYLTLLWRARRSLHLSAFRDAFRREPALRDGTIEPAAGDDR